MKIIHICLTGGYTENSNYQENYLTKFQALSGNDVYIITTQYCWHENIWEICKKTEYYNTYGVYIIRLPYKWNLPYKINTYLGVFSGLYPKLKEIGPDLIFIHNLQFQDIKLIKKYKKNYPEVEIVADNHSDFSNSARNWLSKNILYKFYWRNIAKSIEPYVKKFYGVIPARVDFLKNVYLISPQKTDLLMMGADDDLVYKVSDGKAKEEFRKKYHIEKDDFLIITGGKIDSFKKQTLLLMEAVRNILDSRVKLCVFGSIEKNMQKDVERYCTDLKIQYIGWIKPEETYKVFSAADLVVFPGRHSVFWEQVAGMGIPMICKYWEGTTHIDVGGNVRFLKKDSAEEIQDLVQHLVECPDEYQKMLKAAKEKGMERFSYKKISERVIAVSL